MFKNDNMWKLYLIFVFYYSCFSCLWFVFFLIGVRVILVDNFEGYFGNDR